MILRRHVLGLAGATLLLAGGAPAAVAETIDVVASFSVLGDVVKQVGGDHVSVSTLVGPNGDPHEYQPAPNAARELRDAKLVFVSGLGLEGWLDRLVTASGYKGEPVAVSARIKPREGAEEDGEVQGQGHDHDHDHGHDDPHVWNDPKNVMVWVDAIEQALAKADPADREAFAANAKAYKAKLTELDDYARTTLGRTPEKDRKILTSHDAFGYFGDAYHVTFLSPLGLSTESEASAKGVAALIEQIKTEKIKTYFFENSNDPRLVKQIAQATGAQPGGELYVESLSAADGPAPTYAQMFRYNVDQIAMALSKTN